MLGVLFQVFLGIFEVPFDCLRRVVACCSAFTCKHKHRGTLRELRTEVLDVNIEIKWKDIYLQSLTLSSLMTDMFESVKCDIPPPFSLSLSFWMMFLTYTVHMYFFFCVCLPLSKLYPLEIGKSLLICVE